MVALTFLLFALAGLGAAFALLWALCRWMDNYSFVDAAAVLAVGAVASFYAWYGPGWFLRSFTIAAMAVLWSVRLGLHLFTRTMREHPAEAERYRRRREHAEGAFHLRMFGVFQGHAVIVVLLSLPLLLPSLNRGVNFHGLEIAGVVIWFIGLYGESLADGQLAAFQRDPANRSRVCEAGLWHFSRHPNYFFDWLIWIGFAVFALASPHGWLGLVAPAIVLQRLLGEAGIPAIERQALHSAGDAYRRYQQTTSAFVPWLRRKGKD